MFQKFFLTFVLLAGAALFPLFTAQADEHTTDRPMPVNLPNPLSGDLQPTNELDQYLLDSDIQNQIVKFVVILFRLLAIGAIIPIVVGGFQLIISQGGEYAQKGKKTLYWGVVGLLIAFLGILIFDYLLVIFLPK